MPAIGFFFLAVLFHILAAQGFAQALAKPGKEAKVNFTGTWRLSKVTERGTFPKQPEDHSKPTPDEELIISQSLESITVKGTFKDTSISDSKESIYYVDGRGETNKGYDEGFTYESRTKLKGRKVVIEMTIRIKGVKTINYVREEWELAPDAKTLIIRSRTHSIKEASRGNFGISPMPGYDRIYKLLS